MRLLQLFELLLRFLVAKLWVVFVIFFTRKSRSSLIYLLNKHPLAVCCGWKTSNLKYTWYLYEIGDNFERYYLFESRDGWPDIEDWYYRRKLGLNVLNYHIFSNKHPQRLFNFEIWRNGAWERWGYLFQSQSSYSFEILKFSNINILFPNNKK